MKRASLLLLAMVAGLAGSGSARAAALATEPFSAGLNGWTNNLDATKWVASTQAARVSFAFSLFPQVAALEAGPAASGGAFAGDFRAAGVETIGFSLFAENTLPSQLKIELTGGTNVFFQDLRPRMTAVGVWHYFLVSLTDRDAARWSGFSPSDLPLTLTNIDRVAIRITTSGTASQAYRLDDVFLDILPTIGAVNGTNVTADALRTNFVYRIETADALTNTWSSVLSFAATNRTEIRAVTNSAPALFLRLQN